MDFSRMPDDAQKGAKDEVALLFSAQFEHFETGCCFCTNLCPGDDWHTHTSLLTMMPSSRRQA